MVIANRRCALLATSPSQSQGRASRRDPPPAVRCHLSVRRRQHWPWGRWTGAVPCCVPSLHHLISATLASVRRSPGESDSWPRGNGAPRSGPLANQHLLTADLQRHTPCTSPFPAAFASCPPARPADQPYGPWVMAPAPYWLLWSVAQPLLLHPPVSERSTQQHLALPEYLPDGSWTITVKPSIRTNQPSV
jgi:hypothetical protein